MTSPSLYEHLFPLTTVLRQHFVDNFDGETLNERWNAAQLIGVGGAATMVDAVDEGLNIASGTAVGGTSAFVINFNSKRQYDFANCVLIFVMRAVQGGSRGVTAGLANDAGATGNHHIWARDDTARSFVSMRTRDTSSTDTDTDLGLVTIFRSFKIKLTSSVAQLFVNGVLKASTSSTLPDLKLQPFCEGIARTTINRDFRYRSIEAFNT